MQIIEFYGSKPETFEALGLNYNSISNIFLCESSTETPSLPLASPGWARAYIFAEYRAAEITFRAIREGAMITPHPITGWPEVPVRTLARQLKSTAALALFKFVGDSNTGYCLVFAGTSSRATHIVIPSRSCVAHYLDAGAASDIWDAAMDLWQPWPAEAQKGPSVAMIDMVTNLAHQAMNHLSGIERLVHSGLHHSVDEIWLCGTEFFGPTEKIFPELRGKLRKMERQEAASRMIESGYNVYKVGSNVVTKTLAERLVKLSLKRQMVNIQNSDRSPLIAFTIRAGGRRCLNLPNVVAEVVGKLLPAHPNLGVVLDGWVFPESSIECSSNIVSALSYPYFNILTEEAAVCKEIARNLPPGVLVRNLIGAPILDSVSGLQDIDAYVAHVGTLQHKIGWLTNANGIVHGPTTELTKMESSAYSCERASAPMIIPPAHVVDVPVDSPRGPGYFDYRIVDTSMIVEGIVSILKSRSVYA